MNILRSIIISLRSFNIRYIKGQRNKKSQQELVERHFDAVIDSIPAMELSLRKRRK